MPNSTEYLAQGRDLIAQGRHADALECFSAAAYDPEGYAAHRAAAAAVAVEVSLVLGRPRDALRWVERLRALSGHRDQAALLEALARVGLGEGEAALTLLAQVDDPDTAEATYPPSSRSVLESQALALVGRDDEAVAAVARALGQDPTDATAWQQLAVLAGDPGLDLGPALDAVPDDRFADTLGNLATAPVPGTDRILEALWERQPGDSRVLVLLGHVGPGLGLERALEWSGRMRAVGAGDECPLLAVAATPTRPAEERVRAAAMASVAFGDPRAGALVELAAGAVPTAELAQVLDLLGALAPDLVGAYTLGAADGPARAFALAAALRARDAEDAAVALVRHAVAQEQARLRVELPPAEIDALAEAAAARGEEVLADALRAVAAR